MVANIERDFAALIEEVLGEANYSARAVYTELAIQHAAGSDRCMRHRINNYAAFWLATLANLQAAGFIALGRLYDGRRGTVTLGTLLDQTERNRGLFSRDALYERKRQQRSMSDAEWLQYADEAYHPIGNFMTPWREEWTRIAAIYRDRIEPIRHQVFAHNAPIARQDIDNLFGRLPVRELEQVTVFPIRLTEAVWNLFHNGREPNPVNYELRTNVAEICANPVPEGTMTWVHLHAVTDALRFMESLPDPPGGFAHYD